MRPGDKTTVYKRTVTPTKTDEIGYPIVSTKTYSATIVRSYADGCLDVTIDGKPYSTDKNKFLY